MSSYEYEIEYQPGSKVANADALSRLPLPETTPESSEDGSVELLIHQLSEVIVTANQIKNWTEKDPILSRVHHFVLHGWPNIVDNEDLKPYFNRRDELSIVKGVSYGDHE